MYGQVCLSELAVFGGTGEASAKHGPQTGRTRLRTDFANGPRTKAENWASKANLRPKLAKHGHKRPSKFKLGRKL